ncbi:MAG: putative Glutamate--tRNA ligase, partial [Streblomastix strix]
MAIRNKCNNKTLRDSSLIHASEANFSHADIPGGEGGVCTRFPPEPSGYLHIGHIKAAMLNEYYAHKFHGRLLLRFDDTNPTNEKGEFEEAIIKDLDSVGIVADNVSHTSDYFDHFLECADEMIKIGKAYADNSTQEQMKHQRENMIESPNRDNTIQKNQEIWLEMKNGSDIGKTYALRAKVDMKSKNTTLRDPVIYRCKTEPHPRTGDKYKAYPSYDFACPIIDSKEGVTVALRTIEYRDRNAQYAFMQDALKIRPVPIQDFARLNFLYTEMSKRKLQKFVDDGIASGWNDPRFPTIQGIMRNGMTIPALRAFVLEQGPSKNITYQEWDKIWAKNRQVIDPLAPRYTAIEVDNVVRLVIVDGPEQPEVKKLAVNKKDPDHGEKDVVFSKEIIIEQCDAQLINDNEEVTLMSWGNIIVDKIIRDTTRKIPSPLPAALPNDTVDLITNIEAHLHLEGDFKKTKLKLTWLSAANLDQLPIAQLKSFDHLLRVGKIERPKKTDELEDDNLDEPTIQSSDQNINRTPDEFINKNSVFQCNAYIEPAATTGIEGDIVQFERKGNFYLDKIFEQGKDGKITSGVYHFVPDGRTMLMKVAGRQLVSISEQQKAEELVHQKEAKEKAAQVAKDEKLKNASVVSSDEKGEQQKEKEQEQSKDGKKEKKTKQAPQQTADADAKKKADLDAAFSLCNFRIIQLKNCRKHPDADKLIIADADIGDGIIKTLVTGLIPHYQPEDIEG